jgi:hypothetical protein
VAPDRSRVKERSVGAGKAAGETLRGYAERGVFRGFAERPGRNGGQDFEFRWLAGATFRVRLDPAARRLTFRDLLPNVPRHSAMDRAFRVWVNERASDSLPEHRRIDPRRVSIACTNRAGKVSVALALRRRGGVALADEWSYAARKGVSLVNEIFHGFLRGPYYDYMVLNFGEPEE